MTTKVQPTHAHEPQAAERPAAISLEHQAISAFVTTRSDVPTCCGRAMEVHMAGRLM